MNAILVYYIKINVLNNVQMVLSIAKRKKPAKLVKKIVNYAQIRKYVINAKLDLSYIMMIALLHAHSIGFKLEINVKNVKMAVKPVVPLIKIDVKLVLNL